MASPRASVRRPSDTPRVIPLLALLASVTSSEAAKHTYLGVADRSRQRIQPNRMKREPKFGLVQNPRFLGNTTELRRALLVAGTRRRYLALARVLAYGVEKRL